MKKLMKSFVILAVVAIALGSASAVFAQASSPGNTTSGTGMGYGVNGTRGSRGSGAGMLYQNQESLEDGYLQDEMIAAFADAFNMDVEELEARLAAGETLAQISGLPIDEFRALLAEVQASVHEQSIGAGLFQNSQVGGLYSRGAGMSGFSGMRGSNQGFYGTGECQID
jgi:hypothetical protein